MVKKILNKIVYFLEFFYLKIFYEGFDKIGAKNHSVSSKLIHYISSVRKFVSSDRSFKNFKRSLIYREVLEHVDYELANKYIEEIRKNYINYFQDEIIEQVSDNDRVGRPHKFKFKINFQQDNKTIRKEVSLSGPTIRYLFVFCHIQKNLNLNNDLNYIAEIGGGYGGQALVFDRLIQFKKYFIFDLPSVNRFSKKYLNNFYLNNSFNSMDINEYHSELPFDLVISNYAFSELPRELQDIYLKKVILKSKSGYMTMNTGNDINSNARTNRYKASELLGIIQSSQIIEEIPLSSKDNYIIIWGDLNL